MKTDQSLLALMSETRDPDYRPRAPVRIRPRNWNDLSFNGSEALKEVLIGQMAGNVHPFDAAKRTVVGRAEANTPAFMVSRMVGLPMDYFFYLPPNGSPKERSAAVLPLIEKLDPTKFPVDLQRSVNLYRLGELGQKAKSIEGVDAEFYEELTSILREGYDRMEEVKNTSMVLYRFLKMNPSGEERALARSIRKIVNMTLRPGPASEDTLMLPESLIGNDPEEAFWTEHKSITGSFYEGGESED